MIFFYSKKFEHAANVKRGFTLVEIMVALMIFSIVVIVALAALVKILDANKKAQTIHDAVIHLSFTMEAMSRELRTGSLLYCRVLSPGTDLTIPGGYPTEQPDNIQCLGNDGTTGNGIGFAFLSSRPANCPGSDDRLVTAYEIVPSGSAFVFKKALQTTCGGALSFEPVISSEAATINGYYVDMKDDPYPLAYLKISAQAGLKESEITAFDIQTAASSRVPLP